MLVPVAFLALHFFVLSNASLKTDPKPKDNLKDAALVEINLQNLDIAGDDVYEKTGIASYYADKFHNRTTASGEVFNMNEFSAAHKSLPFGTILRVTNMKTNKSTLVRVNDRGPYVGRRILDLSKKSAQAIGSISTGTAKVRIEGFLAGKKGNGSLVQDDYVYAYSLKSKPLCVPYDVFDIVDSSRVFNSAVTKIKQYTKHNTDKDYYLVQYPSDAANGIKHRDYFYIVSPKQLTLESYLTDSKLY